MIGLTDIEFVPGNDQVRILPCLIGKENASNHTQHSRLS